MTEPKIRDSPGRADGIPVRDLWRIEALPEDVIESPLDRIFAQHLRHREAAQIMAFIADGDELSRPDKLEIYALLGAFLAADFIDHTVEEEQAFFPLLREHCEPQDGIDRVLDRLSGDHAIDNKFREDLVRALSNAADGGDLDASVRRQFRAFSEHVRQHIALENAVVLPIARARLNAAALQRLDELLQALRRPAKNLETPPA